MSERDRDPDGTTGAPGTVAGFRLLRKIGEGGMSAVYQSYDVAAGRPVAVKLLADHLDVKPDNILLHPGGAAKLADLGLAKRLNDDSQLTSIHQGVGTSYYMLYEQSVNANLVDGRSDIFALGATLYHLLTGEVPFA